MYIDKEKSAVKFNISRRGVADFALLAGGFLAARALVFDAASPFVMAYISAFLFKGPKFYAAALFASFGILSSFRGEFSMKYLLAIILLCAANLFVTIKPRMGAGMLQAASAAVATLICGVILVFIRGQGFYSITINLLEAALIFALAIVLAKGINCVAPKTKRGPLNGEELIATALLAAVLAIGAADVSIWHFSLRHFSAVLIVLLAASGGGAAIGAVCGIFLGFMLNITGFEYIYFAVLLAAAGFAAGGARVYGKAASIAAFSVVALLCAMYFDHALLTPGALVSLTAACVAFFVLPRGFLLNIHTNFNPAIADHNEAVARLRQRAVERVCDFGEGYAKLAVIFEERMAGRRVQKPEKAISEARAVVCEACPKCKECWGRADTEGYLQEMAEKVEKQGRLDFKDVPLAFSSVCIKLSYLLEVMTAQAERRHFNKDWEHRLAEARGLVAQQFSGLAHVMHEFAAELDIALDFRKDIENRIVSEFAKKGRVVENVSATENADGKIEVYISKKGRPDEKKWQEIATLLSEILGRKMELFEEKTMGRLCYLHFKEQQKFYIQSGVAKASKANAKESGDSFSLVQLKDGCFVAALSDGMGSGSRAKEESEAAIELLEELMERGFQKDIALRLINSALLLKSNDEFFSTLDICFMDINSGRAEFIKIGAACSYILRRGEVETIGNWTLPVGILENIDIDVHETQLSHGDVIVMMTDGVTDSVKNQAGIWVEESLKKLPKKNPQELADHILDIARENYAGNVRDDMTVMAVRILKQRR